MKKLLAFTLILVSCCGPLSNDKDNPPVKDTDWCQAAEDNLFELECTNPDGTPMWVNQDGEKFKVTCEIIQDEGLIFLNPKCIASAETCDEANACPQY